MNENNKRILIPAVIGVLVLIIMVVGATFAYFSVGTTNNFGTKTIEAEAAEVGSVALVNVNNSLSMNLTREDMMKKVESETYFATPNGTRDGAISIGKGYYAIPFYPLAKLQLSGTGTYKCDYTMQITASGTNNMYTAFQGMNGKEDNQIELRVSGGVVNDSGNDREYDFYTANLFPIIENGYMVIDSDYNASTPVYSNEDIISTFCSGLTGDSLYDCVHSSNSQMLNALSGAKSIYASFSVINSNNVDQTALAGTDITLNFSFTDFECTALSTAERDALMQSFGF